MCRNYWELTDYVRHHIADLADERRVCSSIDLGDAGLTRLVVRLRHRLGKALIQVGYALGGDDGGRGVSTPTRPAPWGLGS